MKQIVATVTENARLYGNTYVTWFAAPELLRAAVPGQFLMLRVTVAEPDCRLPCDPLLPRPFSFHRLREGPDGTEWSLLYDVVGRGTQWLASRTPGDAVACWGPLGRGFSVRPTSQQLLLVAGGVGVAPLVWLAEAALADNKSVTLVLGGRSAEQIYPASQLPAEVEVIVTTEDGSLGRRGLATEDFLEHLEWCDQAFACGPNPMFQAMARVMHGNAPRRPVQVLMEEGMACGAGICYGCAVETKKGMRLVCKDGPRFDLRDIF